jgi:hypothetical protein
MTADCRSGKAQEGARNAVYAPSALSARRTTIGLRIIAFFLPRERGCNMPFQVGKGVR